MEAGVDHRAWSTGSCGVGAGADTEAILREIARAKARFGLSESAAVFSCYEAGRDGFWLDRFLHTTVSTM